jgi:hypothetical protein
MSTIVIIVIVVVAVVIVGVLLASGWQRNAPSASQLKLIFMRSGRIASRANWKVMSNYPARSESLCRPPAARGR